MRLRRTRHGRFHGFAGSLSVYGLVLPGIIRALTFSPPVFIKTALRQSAKQYQETDQAGLAEPDPSFAAVCRDCACAARCSDWGCSVLSMLDQLMQPACWERFCAYKSALAVPDDFVRRLRQFIDARAYQPVCDAIARGDRFPLPQRAVISKQGSTKKRTVYTYPAAENTVLKLLTYLLLRKYDAQLSGNLYSFRPGRSAKDAVLRLSRTAGIQQMYAYKADISNYFNSVQIPLLLPKLSAVMQDDPRLFAFLRSLLEEPQVRDGSRILCEEKGIMAGTPLSSFYANLFLSELDRHFEAAKIPYARYSDDIILFAPSRAETEQHAAYIRSFLASHSLKLNPAKEQFTAPEEGWCFLGFQCIGRRVDIAPVSVNKVKQKMRRKTRALLRWKKRNGMRGEQAAAAFLRIFNRKLLENSEDSDLTWSCWFFAAINTTDSLHEIDCYAQDCIRVLLTGKRTKARFNARYEDLKRLGYRSLVHEYYAGKAETEEIEKQH